MFKRICSLVTAFFLVFAANIVHAQQVFQMDNKAYCTLSENDKVNYLTISGEESSKEYYVLYPNRNNSGGWYWKAFASHDDVEGAEKIGEIAFRYSTVESLNSCIKHFSSKGVRFHGAKKVQEIGSMEDIVRMPF